MTAPKVFISYSHDTARHQERVLDLADRLRADGIDAEIDQYNDAPPEGWPLWCERQIEIADFVLMVCTEAYHRRVRGEGAPGKGLLFNVTKSQIVPARVTATPTSPGSGAKYLEFASFLEPSAFSRVTLHSLPEICFSRMRAGYTSARAHEEGEQIMMKYTIDPGRNIKAKNIATIPKMALRKGSAKPMSGIAIMNINGKRKI
jgi:hypothetical protein